MQGKEFYFLSNRVVSYVWFFLFLSWQVLVWEYIGCLLDIPILSENNELLYLSLLPMGPVFKQKNIQPNESIYSFHNKDLRLCKPWALDR